MKKVLIIFGGNSFEQQVSFRSAKCILENINRTLFNPTAVSIDNNNDWYLFNHSLDILLTDNRSWQTDRNKITNIIEFIKNFDVVFPVLHGPNGEDGTIQGMFEIFNIKYVGSKTKASAVGMDKELTKLVCKKLNIPVVPYLIVKGNYPYKKIETTLSYPVVVKPANGGSSCGVTKVNNRQELKQAIKIAEQFDKKIMIEQFIIGRELECAVLEKKKVEVSTIGEIISETELYDYDSKYVNNQSQTLIPSRLPKNISTTIKKYAKEIFDGIGAKNLSRVDFFYDEENKKVYLNEINTLPGFTSISMYPKLWSYDKINCQDLITILINNA